GQYSGSITIQGASVPLHVPYLFIAGAGFPANLIEIRGIGDGAAGQDAGPIAVKPTDQFGIPITPVSAAFSTQGGSLKNPDSKTDAYGIASAEAFLGPQPGRYDFNITGLGLSWDFLGVVLVRPTITRIVDGASFEPGQAVAPGSYISIFGNSLSETVG